MFTRRSATTGIDVGLRTAMLVRTESTGSEPLVTHWGIERFPESDGSAAATSEALSRLLKRLGLKPRDLGRVATAAGGTLAVVRQAGLPPLDLPDLKQALPYEARKHLPLDNIKKPGLECQVLPETALSETDRAEGKLPVLLAALPQTERAYLLESLAGCGVEPDVMDIHPLPEVNAMLAAHTPSVTDPVALGVLSLTDRAQAVAVVYPGGELYTRTLEQNGNPTLSEAGIQHLIRQIGDTLRFLNTKNRTYPVREFFLCGWDAADEGLREIVATAIGVPMNLPAPFRGMRLQPPAPEPSEGSLLAAAVGLSQWWREADV